MKNTPSLLPKEGESWYLAGKMTGEPRFGFDQFELVVGDLREKGFKMISPHELDHEQAAKEAWASDTGDVSDVPSTTWGDCLARDVKIVADQVTGIIAFGKWRESRGARLETFVAFLCDKPVYAYPSLTPVRQYTLDRTWLGD